MVRTNFLTTTPLLMASFCLVQEKPNTVLILVDDMGYPDIGCYGGEILTPNIDALVSKDVYSTQFYNTSRSCPACASLMAGLYQHQTGIEQMPEDPFASSDRKSPNNWGVQGYKGYLNRNCVTIAEVPKENGYRIYMAGKWHLGMHGEERWSLQRGLERFHGVLSGACSYLRPSGGHGLVLDNTKLPASDAPYYTTDAFADYIIQSVDGQKDNHPFLLYLAFNAPHWPLHAEEKDIQEFTKTHRKKDWDETWEARRKRVTKMGITDSNTDFVEQENRKWNELIEQEKDQVVYRMVVYAAQVHCVDYNIGKLINCLKRNHRMDDTLILFMPDNGAYAELYKEPGGGKVEEVNDPVSSFTPTYGEAWTQVSNIPFRRYKRRAYRGGISTPLILLWEGALGNKKDKQCRIPGYLPDVTPTISEVTGAKCPETCHGGNKIYPLADSSLSPAVHKKTDSLHEYMYWERQNNRAIRWGDWKATRDEKDKGWELYDIVKDRIEHFNVAEQHPEVLTRLVTEWERWAHVNFVLPKHPKK